MTAVSPKWQAYTAVAPLYDALSAELVYRRGREVALQALGLRPGDQVVDLGCGTGLNFERIASDVGVRGRIVAIDSSGAMLKQARRRVNQPGWPPVELICADATTVPAQEVLRHLSAPADAVISTYALSLMPAWEDAWSTALQVVRPGAGVAVVDMRIPSGRSRWAAPLARLACTLGRSDPHAHPWRAVEADCEDVQSFSLRAGHVQVRVGRVARRP